MRSECADKAFNNVRLPRLCPGTKTCRSVITHELGSQKEPRARNQARSQVSSVRGHEPGRKDQQVANPNQPDSIQFSTARHSGSPDVKSNKTAAVDSNTRRSSATVKATSAPPQPPTTSLTICQPPPPTPPYQRLTKALQCDPRCGHEVSAN